MVAWSLKARPAPRASALLMMMMMMMMMY